MAGAPPYGDHVVDRQLIEVDSVLYYRKVWDNGYADFCARVPPQLIQRRRQSGQKVRWPITEAEWDALASVHHVERVVID
jgi:hypothetical protein